MKSFIKSVDVKELWGVKNIHIDFFDDVNILIGGNGSGKTTFLLLVEGLLTLDLSGIEDFEFSEVVIIIQSEEGLETVTVQRFMEDAVMPVYRYNFQDGEIIEIRNMDGRIFASGRSLSRASFLHLKNRLDEIVNVSWLSVNRFNENISRSDRRYETNRTDVDLKLGQLMSRIVSYRLQLETKVNERTKKFNEDLVSLLLYSDEYDKIPNLEKIKKIQSYKKEDIVTELHRVYSYFGNASIHTAKIKQHVEQIKHVVDKIEANEEFDPNEMLSFSLMSRTLEILKISSDYQKERTEILEPINTYLETVGQYLKDKRIAFDGNTSKLTPSVNIGGGKERLLDVSALSSGEKQILILLTETLLQQKAPFIYIADEPELSLHIEWQRNLVNSIRSLNPNAQIIFATHAPEIAASHQRKLVNMQNATSYVEK
ncbi:MAG: ATP-binding protein [Prevotella sp.]|nr:ATP-binding protein [Prevotella sp.]